MNQKTELITRERNLIVACENFGNTLCECGYCNVEG